MKAVRLSALHTGRLYPPPPRKYSLYSFLLSRPQCHSAAGRIMSTNNSNDIIGNTNPRPSDLKRSASTNCATACPLSQVDMVGFVFDTILSSCWIFCFHIVGTVFSVSGICLGGNRETAFTAMNNMRDGICTKFLANGRTWMLHNELLYLFHLTLLCYIHSIYLLTYLSPSRFLVFCPRVAFRSHYYSPDVSIMDLVS